MINLFLELNPQAALSQPAKSYCTANILQKASPALT